LCSRNTSPFTQREVEGERIQVDAERELAQLRVVAAAETGRDFQDFRAVRTQPQLCVARPVADADRLRRPGRDVGWTLCSWNTFSPRRGRRPRVRQRHAERRRFRRQAIGHRQRTEEAVDGHGVDGHLRALEELLDDDEAVAGGRERCRDRRGQVLFPRHHRQPALPLPVGSLDHARHRGLGEHARLRHPGLVQPFALPQLRRDDCAGRGVDRVRQAVTLGDARRDPDGPVRPGRDDPVDVLGLREPVDRGLVLARDDRALVGVPEAGRRGVAVGGDDEEPPLAGRSQEPELRRAGA
jgi:hypothetical protein